MGTSALIVALAASSSLGAAIPEKQVELQDSIFTRLWGTEFEWKFESLPTKGSVPKRRVPYSGYIYPDTAGGTSSALSKYDRAFNRGRGSATSWERWDTTAYQEPVNGGSGMGLFGRRGGLFASGGLFGPRMQTPYWHGHCNGWTAAAMRHAEPQRSVVRNGVRFTPADIKGLLAEIYIYNDTEMLAGDTRSVNAGEFHAILANWLGRGQHPVAMEADPSEEKWNYPIYSFASSHAKRSGNRVEVKTNIAYAKDSQGEYQESPRIQKIKYFHYMLNLNEDGKIVGGYFLRDSSVIDMVWLPLRPKAAGRPGNKRGNPHVNIDTVLALWRASVPEEERMEWFVADPAEADAVVYDESESVIPTQGNEVEPADDNVADLVEETITEVAISSNSSDEATASETNDVESDVPARLGE